ncbi:transposase mutator type [Actinobacteria bacterium OK006]|nr:transposase mutator type [Actinobacteria bacterium OK006]
MLVGRELAVTVEGTREILGLWAGDGGEGAKYWLQVLTEIKNRGVDDVCMVVCDGLKGSLPDAIGTVWPQAITQTCVVHLLRASFRYAVRQDWDKISKALKPVYTAPTQDVAEARFPPSRSPSTAVSPPPAADPPTTPAFRGRVRYACGPWVGAYPVMVGV